MIGQCLRFYPQYEFLKESIDSGKYGKVISAFFERLSGPPVWGWQNWFMDETKSGGCLMDLHIHDIDVARFLFGEPKEVACTTQRVICGYDTVQTQLFYNDMLVAATGDWSMPTTFGFRHSYRVNFENALILFENNEVTVYERDGATYKPEISTLDGITNEIAYLVDIIDKNKINTLNTAASAAKTIRLIETMKQSADNNGIKVQFI